MNNILNSLTVLRGLKRDNLFLALAEYCCAETNPEEKFNDLLYEIYSVGAEKDVCGYLSNLIICDDNALSRAFASGKSPSEFVINAFIKDLETIKSAAEKISMSDKFAFGKWAVELKNGKSGVPVPLASLYRERGFGKFIYNKAFTYSDGNFVPLGNADEITLGQIKNYEEEKRRISSNIDDFLNGLPYSHMLLYGDKGTGKSSTVHAMINKFCDRKLRLIELKKSEISLLPSIKSKAEKLPLKFIIFLDDLSLDDKNDDVSTLKTLFEGSFSNSYGNIMLVATSNRRHIVKENQIDRQSSVHMSDAIDEQLSLSDRFALTVMFSSTDKQNYLSITQQLADDRKLKMQSDELCALAERWAIVKGGRSPRRAKQFVDYVYACEQSGRAVEF